MPDELRATGRARLCGHLASEQRVCLIHPGSGGVAKCWPVEQFAEVARGLRKRDHMAVFLLGPAETERWSPARVADLEREFRVLRLTEPAELPAILSGADAYIGNDAGPTHLAALLGTRTVALFGPTSAAVWHPLGRDVRVLTGDPAVGPLWGLSAEAVIAAALD